MGVFALVALGLGGAAVAFASILAARRILLARRERASAEAVARLRPLALRLIEGERDSLTPLGDRDARGLASVLARYARSLSGVSRERMTAFFEEHGHVDAEVDALGSRRAWQRATAAYALGDMGSARAVPALCEALDDPSRDVRSAASRSLGRLGAPGAVQKIVEGLAGGEIPHATAGQSLLDIGAAALPALRSLLSGAVGASGEIAIATRIVTVELIGLLGGPEDARLVQSRLGDPSAQVREQAARALGTLGADRAAGELRRALGDRIPLVRAAAAEALGVMRDPGAVPALLAQARDDEFEPAQAAARALLAFDPGSVLEAAGNAGAGPHLQEAADLVEARA